MEYPPVSVVMPARNEEQHLAEAVRHVLGQDYPGPLELVLAVGPSADRTEQVARALLGPVGGRPDGEYELERAGVVLAEDVPDRLGEVLFLVPGRHHDGHGRVFHGARHGTAARAVIRYLQARVLQHLGDQGGDLGALGADQGDVGEQRVALELLDHRDHAVVPADPQVVALGDVVGEHYPGPGADPGQHGEQDAALQRLRLVHDHERVVQRPAADVGQREHLEHVPGQHLVDDVLGGDRGESVVDGLSPGAHLVRLRARQVAEFLAADRIQRPEHDDLAVLPALHHGLQAGAQRERGLAGACPATKRDDADLGVEQQVQRDALLGAAAPQPERLPVTAHQLHGLVRLDPAQRTAVGRAQHEPGVAGQLAGGFAIQGARFVQLLDVTAGHLQLGHPGPARVHRQFGAVLLGGQPDGGGLDPQRQVLAHQHDVLALGGQAAGHRQDPRVVVPEPEPGREHRGVGMVELDLDRAAEHADRQLRVQPAVLDAQVIEVAQGLAGEVAEFGMVTLGFQLGDDDDRQDYPVLIEASDGGRVGEQDAGVEYIRTATFGFDHADSLDARYEPGAGQDTDVSDGPGLALEGPRRPFSSRLHAKREAWRSEGPPGGRRRAVHHY